MKTLRSHNSWAAANAKGMIECQMRPSRLNRYAAGPMAAPITAAMLPPQPREQITATARHQQHLSIRCAMFYTTLPVDGLGTQLDEVA